MRKIANLFMLLFTLAAIVSLVAEGLQTFTAWSLPPLPLQIIWFSCFTMALILYIGYGFNRHLPPLILLPAQLWLLWKLLDYWPLEPAVGSDYNLYASLAQLILALILLQLNRVGNGESLFFVQKQFSGSAFSGMRLFKFSLLNIFVAPILLLLVVFSLSSELIKEKSAGFVRLKPNGLYMQEKTYRQGDKQIQMMAMIHLARSQYYTDLFATIPQQNTLILLEGVTDKNGLMKEQFSYNKIATMLGLTAQQTSHFHGRMINQNSLNSLNPNEKREIDLFPADIDLSHFDPLTIKVINALAREVLSAENPIEGYAVFSRWAEQNIPADFDQIVMYDLLDKRNQKLVSFLPAALRKYDHLVIPWGALHMKGLEQELFERGFEVTKKREHLSIDFLLLPFEQWWQQLTG